jgi:hypothetical protein
LEIDYRCRCRELNRLEFQTIGLRFKIYPDLDQDPDPDLDLDQDPDQDPDLDLDQDPDTDQTFLYFFLVTFPSDSWIRFGVY